jgi:hypothetical protein
MDEAERQGRGDSPLGAPLGAFIATRQPMSERTVPRRGRSHTRKSTRAEQRRIELELQKARRLLDYARNHRVNPDDDDEDPTRRAGARQ